jgi:hypothetical protein
VAWRLAPPGVSSAVPTGQRPSRIRRPTLQRPLVRPLQLSRRHPRPVRRQSARPVHRRSLLVAHDTPTVIPLRPRRPHPSPRPQWVNSGTGTAKPSGNPPPGYRPERRYADRLATAGTDLPGSAGSGVATDVTGRARTSEMPAARRYDFGLAVRTSGAGADPGGTRRPDRLRRGVNRLKTAPPR